MKLHWSPRSPFVRKVMIVAHERGVTGRITCVRTVAAMTKPHAELMKDNPLSKIRRWCSTTAWCSTIYPSSANISMRSTARRSCFRRGPQRGMTALRRQALGDGFLDLLVLARNERERAAAFRVHLASMAVRKAAVLDSLEREARVAHHDAVWHRPYRDRLRAVLSRFPLCR